MKINQKGLDLIKQFEGFRSTAYKCPAGVWTIGYGHTSAAGKPIVVRGMKISREYAERILLADLEKYERTVRNILAGRLNSNQFSACVSLCYNIGPGAFKRSSVLRYINSGRVEEAADKFLLWNKGGGKVLRGLVRRRKAERDLYLSEETNS